jgi:hypothetical protein
MERQDMPETTVTQTTDYVSHTELIAGLKRLTDATTQALMLGRDTQHIAFALADSRRLIRRAESMMRRLEQPAVDTDAAFDDLLRQVGALR